MALEKPSAIYAANILIEDRIDADAYNYLYIKEISKLKFSGLKLANITDFYSVEMLTGFENSKYINYTNQGIPFIRCKNIRDNYFDEDDLTYISEEVYNILKRAQLSDDDLLYTKTGSNLGQVCCVPKGMKAIASSNCCFFKKSQNKSIDSHYVSTFLNSKYGKVQTNRAQTKTGQPTIDFQRLKQFLIPIPSPEIQKYIGDKVRKAEELREEAKRLKKEAEEILNKELNLKDVEFYIKQTNNKKYSWTESIEIEDRIDSEFYKPKYRYLSKLNNMSELSYYYKISKKRINKNIDRKIKYIDLSSVNNIIEPSDFNTKELPSRAQFLVKEGNLIISTLKGSNKISIIPEHLNDSVCSTGFIVIASKSHLTTEYLYLVFSNKVFNMQIERYSTGSIMSGVNHDNFNKMLIPVISNKQIIDTITNKIRKHFRLLYYSKQLIQEAKQDVEDLIEGNFDMSKVKANN